MTADVPMPPATGWHVVAQTETENLDPTLNQFVPGYRVAFTTAGGNSGSVFIPRVNYSAATVAAAVAAHAALLDQVGGLSSAQG
jgi:hypothetical protein